MRKMKKRNEMEKKKEKGGKEAGGVHKPRGYRYPRYEPLRTTAHNDGQPKQNKYKEQEMD